MLIGKTLLRFEIRFFNRFLRIVFLSALITNFLKLSLAFVFLRQNFNNFSLLAIC